MIKICKSTFHSKRDELVGFIEEIEKINVIKGLSLEKLSELFKLQNKVFHQPPVPYIYRKDEKIAEEYQMRGLHKIIWEDVMNGPRKFAYLYGLLEDESCFIFKNLIAKKHEAKTNVLCIGLLKGI